jgi:ATP-dependent helicase HepA
MTGWLNKLVLTRDDSRLFGKCVAEHGSIVEVEFFLSVAEREVRQYPKKELAHAALPAQTRVFFKKAPSIWRVGRVVDSYKEESGAFSYTVKFPNDEIVELPEDHCFVRCLDRYADPSRILAAGCLETQFFADRRRSALRRLRELRSAAQGLTGVVSAPVELVPHQLAAVRRVLTDRHMRYLLADEVGLGKTIEAGLIIRQLLVDDPTINVEILVPDVLVGQWRNELLTKCLISDGAVEVRAHSQLHDVEIEGPPGLLVVDEAHRLITPDSSREASEFSKLQKLALSVPRLLLLSATPALGDEARLLALLNLLDPMAYRMSDLEAFRRRVRDRQSIGRWLLATRLGAAPFVLKQQAKRALELFSDDSVVRDEATRLLECGDDQVQQDAAVKALKTHVANTYRIHQRLLRARRADVEKWTMQPRGPVWPVLTNVRFFFSEDADADTMVAALEAWRDAATRASADDQALRLALSQRWAELVGVAWQGGQALAETVRKLEPVFDGEALELGELGRVGIARTRSENRYIGAARLVREWLVELGTDLGGRPRKLACFASNERDAERLAGELANTLGDSRIVSLVGRGSDSAVLVASFAASGVARVLVCDRASEEGINLQFVHGIVHMDLPLEASRVEQRIGRLDRFGRRIGRVEHRIVMPTDADDSPWRNWFDVLANGFRVFNRSISDVQFQVEALEKEVGLRLFLEGAYAVGELITLVADRLTDERQKLDEQHALDGVAQLVEIGDDLVRSIETSEEDEAAIEADVEPWIKQVLGLHVEPVGGTAAHSLNVSWLKGVLLPAIPWRQALEPAMHDRWTWRRNQAMRGGNARSALIRPGSTLVEVLERIAAWDDRGIAYATWRVEPSWQDLWRGFRLVWLMEPSFKTAGAVYSRRQGSETIRRAEGYLPSVMVEQFVDETGTPVEDEQLLDVLARPYRQQRDERGRFDINLGNRLDGLQEAIDWGQFVDAVDKVVSTGRVSFVNLPEVVDRLGHARRACEHDVHIARRGLAVRRELSAIHPGMVERPLPDEEADLDALLKSINEPAIRLDEIGFFVVAPTPPHT